jgi:hypothetical protein
MAITTIAIIEAITRVGIFIVSPVFVFSKNKGKEYYKNE